MNRKQRRAAESMVRQGKTISPQTKTTVVLAALQSAIRTVLSRYVGKPNDHTTRTKLLKELDAVLDYATRTSPPIYAAPLKAAYARIIENVVKKLDGELVKQLSERGPVAARLSSFVGVTLDPTIVDDVVLQNTPRTEQLTESVNKWVQDYKLAGGPVSVPSDDSESVPLEDALRELGL